MKRVCTLCSFLMLVLAVGTLPWLTGCETDSSDDSSSGLSISPNSYAIPAGVTTNITLTASGGSGTYTWAVYNPVMGSVVASGATAIYASTAAAGQNFVTVTDTSSNAVSATITHY